MGEATKLNNIWWILINRFNSSTWCYKFLSLVAAITYTGHALAWNTKGSVDCSIFLEFVNKLWCFIEKWCHTKTDKCLFILDSATIHRSRKVINFWKKYTFRIYSSIHTLTSPDWEVFLCYEKHNLEKNSGRKN